MESEPQDSIEERSVAEESSLSLDPPVVEEAAAQLRDIVSSLLAFVQQGSGIDDDPEWEALQADVLDVDENKSLHAMHRRIAELLKRIRPETDFGSRMATEAEPAELSVDRITGLADSVEAAKAIQAALASDRGAVIAAFLVHRMSFVNARHGVPLGDKVLLWCSQHLANSVIRPTDLLFRWKGPVFVGILERDVPASQVDSELQRLLGAPLHQFLEMPTKTIYLPIKMTGGVVPASERTLDAVGKWIANFTLECTQGARSA